MSNNLKYLVKNILILAITSILAYISSWSFGDLYDRLFHDYGTFIDLRSLSGLPLSYTFFLTLLFTAFGGGKKYWWIVILLIPAVAFELYFDIEHIYFPVILGVIGWASGYGIQKLITLFRRSNAAN